MCMRLQRTTYTDQPTSGNSKRKPVQRVLLSYFVEFRGKMFSFAIKRHPSKDGRKGFFPLFFWSTTSDLQPTTILAWLWGGQMVGIPFKYNFIIPLKAQILRENTKLISKRYTLIPFLRLLLLGMLLLHFNSLLGWWSQHPSPKTNLFRERQKISPKVNNKVSHLPRC